MILVDGLDINRIPLTTLRNAIGYAPQDAFLFSATVRENVRFGQPNASMDQVRAVTRVSNVLPDIEGFKGQFDTHVGERGITLSGGQKQRLAISRALLGEPPILILDDSLSAVDTETEEKILRELRTAMDNCTAILISHRISTVQLADQIIVLESGKVVERGSHSNLLEAGGYYADLYRKQQLEEELEIG
jgi:ATP-binding cassette subfamily B protein